MTSIKTWHLTCVFQIAPCFDCSLGVSLMCELVTTVPPRKSQSFKPEMNEGHLKFLRKSHNFNQKSSYFKAYLDKASPGNALFSYNHLYSILHWIWWRILQKRWKIFVWASSFLLVLSNMRSILYSNQLFFVIYRPAFFLELFDKSSTIKDWK